MAGQITLPVVKFNGNNFNQVPGLMVLERGDLTPGNRVINQYKLARTNKSVITTAEYSDKPVVIRCSITRPSRGELRASLDQLNSLLADIEGTLDILQDGVTRRYTATVKSIQVTDNQGGKAMVGITFTCSDPFGYDDSESVLLAPTNSTSGNTSFQIAVGGSFSVEPIIVVEFTSITDPTGKTVQITNTQNGIGISLTRDWSNGDTIEINGSEKKVRVNGSEVNPTGKIPSFVPGLRQIGYIDDFTARSFIISASYTKRYS